MTVTLCANFDGGNIDVVDGTDGRWDLQIRRDKDSDFYQWFSFRVDGARGCDLELRIVNAGDSAYPDGWPGYRACVSADNAVWERAETSYGDKVLTIRHTPQDDSVWFAYFAPYPSERHEALIMEFAATPGMRHSVLGASLDGRTMDLLTIGDGPLRVWLYARQHPGETMAEWWMEGALAFLSGDDDAAVRLREAATICIVPNMNPDGSARGHLRTNAVGVNLNREWHAPSLERSPEVLCVLNEMVRQGVDFAIDVHGDEAIPHVFMAGFEGIPSFDTAKFAIYQDYLARLAKATRDFQTQDGYAIPAPGSANLTISTNQVAERFGAIAMTLEMPFKDHIDNPDPVHGWSPERSRTLGLDCCRVLAEMAGELDGPLFAMSKLRLEGRVRG